MLLTSQFLEENRNKLTYRLLNAKHCLHLFLIKLDSRNNVFAALLELIVKLIHLILLDLLSHNSLLFKQETFDLSLWRPKVKELLVLDLFLLSHECFHEKLEVFEVRKFHAKLKRKLLLKDVHKLLPESKIEDCDVRLESKWIIISQSFAKIFDLARPWKQKFKVTCWTLENLLVFGWISRNSKMLLYDMMFVALYSLQLSCNQSCLSCMCVCVSVFGCYIFVCPCPTNHCFWRRTFKSHILVNDGGGFKHFDFR